MAMIVDEGGGPGGFISQLGTPFATPAIAEKGTMDLLIEVATPGGHSSVPPTHTSIGMLSRLLVEFEEHPFEMHLVCPISYDLPLCPEGFNRKDKLQLTICSNATLSTSVAYPKAYATRSYDRGRPIRL